MKKVIILILLTILLLGCIAPAKEPEKHSIMIDDYGNTYASDFKYTQHIQIIHDNERNVTCWVMGVNNGGGISCIPDSQLGK